MVKRFLPRSLSWKSNKEDDDSVNTKKERKPRKSVSFKPKIRVHVIATRRTLDCDNIWYSQAELKNSTQQESQKITNMIQYGVSPAEIQSHGYCLRGFEHKDHKVARESRGRRDTAKFAVLDEQFKQNAMGVYRPEAIAKAYSKCCRSSVEDCVILGKQDEEEATEIYKEAICELMQENREYFAQQQQQQQQYQQRPSKALKRTAPRRGRRKQPRSYAMAHQPRSA